MSKRIEDLEGFIDFAGGLRVLSDKPIDARYVGKDSTFLQSILDIGAAYPGLKVFIEGENRTYVYKKDSEGEYSFQEERFDFSPEEKKVLESGITKEKVSEFERKYTLPQGGITESELSQRVRDSLKLAENSLQGETDPTVPDWAKEPNKPDYGIDEIEGLREALSDKVQKEDNKGLSEENFTSSEKTKLYTIEAGAQENKIEGISINGVEQTIEDKSIDIKLKTLNNSPIEGEGNLNFVDLTENQSIGGIKVFISHPSLPFKETLDFSNPKKSEAASEYQVAKAIEDLGKVLTDTSTLSANRLVGQIPASVGFPTLNQDTTGKAGSADKLSSPVKITVSGKVSGESAKTFDGSNDLEIEVKSLSQNPSDYPTLNQNTTGKAGSADKLSNSRSLLVDLSSESTSGVYFNGTQNVAVPVSGRLPFRNLPLASGLEGKRKVVATVNSTDSRDLLVTELTPRDVGLSKIENVDYTPYEEYLSLLNRVNGLSNMGQMIGAYETYSELPGNIDEIIDKLGVTPKVNDFVTVRRGPYAEGSGLEDSAVTCFSIVAIDKYGNITWQYEYSYNTDSTNKIDKFINPVSGRIPIIASDGGLVDSGKVIEDLIELNDNIPGTLTTYGEKIINSLTSSGTIDFAKKLVHPGTSNPCKHGNTAVPVYFDEGTPIECEQVATFKDGYLVDKNDSYLKVQYSDKAGEAGKLSTSAGSDLRPIYFENGAPKAIGKNLGDLAFVNLVSEASGDVSIGSFRVFKDSYNNYSVKFEEGGNKRTLYITKPVIEGGSGSEKRWGDLIEKLEDKLGVLNIGVIGGSSVDGEYIFSVSNGTHGITLGIPRVRVYSVNLPSGDSIESTTLKEIMGMSEFDLNHEVIIRSNCEPKFITNDTTVEACQGIYFIEISE